MATRNPPQREKKARKQKERRTKEVMRSCVGCRSRKPQNALLRFVLAPDSDVVHLDYLQKLPGRGAYTCAQPSCLQAAVARGGFQRAFRRKVTASFDALMQAAWAASQRHLRGLLSVALRAGQLAVGHSRVEHQLRQQKGLLLLLATDASEGVQRKFERWARRNQVVVYRVLSKAELGATFGGHETSLALVLEAGFAQKIEQEVQRAAQLFPHPE